MDMREPGKTAEEIEMEKINLIAAWTGIFLGFCSGVPLGLFFQNEKWLGGYDSWERRLLRLGHISFFGIAFLNLAFVGSVAYLKPAEVSIIWPSRLFILALIAMPTVCFLAAFKKTCRHLFFVPVLSLLGATGLMVCGGMF